MRRASGLILITLRCAWESPDLPRNVSPEQIHGVLLAMIQKMLCWIVGKLAGQRFGLFGDNERSPRRAALEDFLSEKLSWFEDRPASWEGLPPEDFLLALTMAVRS
jgi:hypothetical protein